MHKRRMIRVQFAKFGIQQPFARCGRNAHCSTRAAIIGTLTGVDVTTPNLRTRVNTSHGTLAPSCIEVLQLIRFCPTRDQVSVHQQQERWWWWCQTQRELQNSNGILVPILGSLVWKRVSTQPRILSAAPSIMSPTCCQNVLLARSFRPCSTPIRLLMQPVLCSIYRSAPRTSSPAMSPVD